ncbi:hypothetical protein [Mesomycoplasma molare]|uniref:Uncharacterized protein n=1 Tax=Mesomycoplasma molare TaxID=171288 RepID=A0ABY5TTS9_9BACT|nr:hypothetical protein [Mesomycoplasma molare]UWD34070.1 hypothetical protein NX772_03110 [Mesomycoplasma molare]
MDLDKIKFIKFQEVIIAASKNVYRKFNAIPLTWEDIYLYGLSIIDDVIKIALKNDNTHHINGLVYSIMFNKLMAYAKSFTTNNNKILNYSIDFEDGILTKISNENNKELFYKEDCEKFFKKYNPKELDIMNLYFIEKNSVKDISKKYFTSSFKIKNFLNSVVQEANDYFK